MRGVPSLTRKKIKRQFLDYLSRPNSEEIGFVFFSYFILTTEIIFLILEKEIEFVLEYLSSGEGCFHNKVVTGFDSLSATSKNGVFWNIKYFHSRLRDEGISKKWERFRKWFKVIKMRNLSNFIDSYKILDILILGVILDYRWQKIEDESGFDPRYFTSASTLGCVIERIKWKVIFWLTQEKLK